MNNVIKFYQEGVIRSILARPKEMMHIMDMIDSSDFEDVNYELIYKSMVELCVENEPVSLPGIALKISEMGGAINTGWLFNLESNMVDWVEKAPPATWASLLKRESSKLKARNVLIEGMEEMNDAASNPLETMDKISSKLTSVSINATSADKFNIKDAILNFKEETVHIQETEGKIAAINSAYPSLDSYTQGWAPTHLITVGARTGIGKSVFAINNAMAALQQGKSVLFFSLEMTEREVISRMVSSLSMVPIHKIEKAEVLTEDEQARVNEALEFIAQSKLNIDSNPHVTIESLKRNSIKQAQSEEGLDFIIIDYLQLIENGGKKNRQEAVSEVSRSVKILAKTLNVPVMVLVQVNRERREEEGDQPPKLHDIRESGAIAQDSNVVILIHRNMEQDAESIDPKAMFILAKNRQGESNKYLSVRTRLECSLFIDDSERAQKHRMDQEKAAQVMQNEEYNNQNNTNNNSINDFEKGDRDLFTNNQGFLTEDTKGIDYPTAVSVQSEDDGIKVDFSNETGNEVLSGENEIYNFNNQQQNSITFEDENEQQESLANLVSEIEEHGMNVSNDSPVDTSSYSGNIPFEEDAGFAESFNFDMGEEYTQDPDEPL